MKILAAYDGTLNSKDVLRYGLHRVKASGGELTVLHVVDISTLLDYEGVDAKERARRESAQFLEDAKKIIADAGKGINVKVTFITAEGVLEEEMARYAKEERVDLILVPQRYASVAKKAPCRVSIVPRDFSMFKILLVDDEAPFAIALAQRLNLRNLKTDIVYDGDQAISYVNREAPDIIILDLRMPGMDGIEVLKQVRQSHPDVQVIILSGRETETDREEAKKLGAFDFVKKPADIDSLVGRIKEAYWTKVEKPPQAFITEG